MRKLLSASVATVIAMGIPMFGIPVSAATNSVASPSVAESAAATQANQDQGALHGLQGDVLRSGASPNDPSTYPYLPPNQLPPRTGPRTSFPKAPPADPSSTSSTTSTDGTLTSNKAGGQQDLPDIALGKPYSIGTQWPDQLFQSEAHNYADTGQLTDGKVASLSFSDKGWVGLLRQYGRSVVVNLGSVQNVQRVSLDFLQNLGAGIEFPDSVTCYASNNGTNWYTIGTAWSQQGAGDYTPQSQAYQVNTDVNAKYIRAQFDDKVFAFTDEFSVYGSTAPEQGAKPLVGEGQDLTQITGDNYLVDPNAPGLPNAPAGYKPVTPPAGRGAPEHGYLTSSDPASAGIRNMQLVYTGSHGSVGTWTKSDFLPMVAQEDANGDPKGWLMDATLFGPYSSNLATNSASWSAWLDDLFSSNIELSALNQAVETTKEKLHDPTFKEKVVITIPSLSKNPSDFGTIDSSGQSLDLNPKDVGLEGSYQNKLKAIQWYMNQVTSRFAKAGLNNLELVGFYWNGESLSVTDPFDPFLIESTANMIHQEHMKFFWIPYYGAVGVTNWRQLGFDDVMVQPNVSFNWGIDAAARLKSVADMDQAYHMGIEIEAHWDVTSATQNLAQTADNKYLDYFTAGNLYGYEGNVMKSYYLNSKSLVSLYQSSDPTYHQIYDDTVKFVNDEWTDTVFK